MANLTTAMKDEASAVWRARETSAVRVYSLILPQINRFEIDLGVPRTQISVWGNFGTPGFQFQASPLIGQSSADYLAKLDYFSWQAMNNVSHYVDLEPTYLPHPFPLEAFQDYSNSPIPNIDLGMEAFTLYMRAKTGPAKGTLIGGPGQGTHSNTAKPNNWQSDHAVDIGLPQGTPILAVADGKVCSGCGFGEHGGGPRFEGERLTLNYGTGLVRSAYYAHLSKIIVRPGQSVRRGQVLGYSGRANGTDHLHFATDRFDPLRIVKRLHG